MEQDTSVYVGAFMRVPGVLRDSNDCHIHCSAGCGEELKATARFCGACGAPASTEEPAPTLGKLREADVNSMPDAYTDDLTSPTYCKGAQMHESIWFSMDTRMGVHLDEDLYAASLAHLNVRDDIDRFSTKFSHVIEAIESRYGIKVTLDWGVVIYAY